MSPAFSRRATSRAGPTGSPANPFASNISWSRAAGQTAARNILGAHERFDAVPSSGPNNMILRLPMWDMPNDGIRQTLMAVSTRGTVRSAIFAAARHWRWQRSAAIARALKRRCLRASHRFAAAVSRSSLRSPAPPSIRQCRAVSEDVDCSARREAGSGKRQVICKNARENIPFFRAGHDKQNHAARFQRRIGQRNARSGFAQ